MPTSAGTDALELTPHLGDCKSPTARNAPGQDAPPDRARDGKVRWFSRHPEWFRLAVWQALVVERPRLPSGRRLAPYEAHVLATVALATDLWGWTWGQSSKWLSAITGVSPQRCRLAMKAGVELGVFLRDRIARGGRFPYRPSGKDGWQVPSAPGEGNDAPFGGYVYRVSHAWTWSISPTNRRVGEFRIAIQLDRHPGSLSLLTDLALLRRSKKRSRASLRDADESDDPARSRELAPGPATRAPETENENVETLRVKSHSDEAAPPAPRSQPGLEPKARDRELGNEGVRRRASGPPPSALSPSGRVTAETMRADLAVLYRTLRL